MNTSNRWARAWPPLLAVLVVSLVGTPAAVASYRHARDVVASTGDTVMAPWLPLSVDGMLLAALVVIWVRRHRGDDAGTGPWAAFLFGMLVTIAANLAAVEVPTPTAYAVALFPPLALAITLELVALVAYRTRTGPAATADQADRTAGPDRADRADRDPVRATVEVVRADRTAADRADRTGLDRADRTALEGGPDRTEELPAIGPDRAGPAPDQGRTTWTAEDEELLEAVREWAAEQTGTISQRAVRNHFRVGPARAQRVLERIEEAA